MQGVHDLGGLEGVGPVSVEADEPVFHSDWERRTLGMAFATFPLRLNRASGQFRHSIERMDPGHYLTSSYYEHWLTGLATRLVEKGVVTAAELSSAAGGEFPLSRPVAAPEARSGPDAGEARFKVGDAVRVRLVSTRGHSRCPQYVQGRAGTVVRVDGVFALPDVDAHLPDGAAAPKEATYCVRFDGLFDSTDPVHVDLWESYLDEA